MATDPTAGYEERLRRARRYLLLGFCALALGALALLFVVGDKEAYLAAWGATVLMGLFILTGAKEWLARRLHWPFRYGLTAIFAVVVLGLLLLVRNLTNG